MASPILFTAVLIFLLAVADARVPTDFKATEIKTTDQFPTDSSDPNILLPSEKQPAESSDKIPDEIPLTILRFRPINRHFPTRPSTYQLINSGHKCHHGVNKLRHWTPRYGLIRNLPHGDTLAAVQETVRNVPTTTNLEDEITIAANEIKKHEFEFRNRLRHGDFRKEWMEEPRTLENVIVKKIRKFLNQF